MKKDSIYLGYTDVGKKDGGRGRILMKSQKRRLKNYKNQNKDFKLMCQSNKKSMEQSVNVTFSSLKASKFRTLCPGR